MASDILVASSSQLCRQMNHPMMSSKVVGNSADGNAIQQNGDSIENQNIKNIIFYAYVSLI